jgi:uncharacterized radical SAM superfamily Fe-S cluster-containing enzyme
MARSIHAPDAPVRDSTSRAGRGYTYYALTKSLCRMCKAPVDGRIVFREGAVWLLKRCPDHGEQECLLSSSVTWYLEALSFSSPSVPVPREPERVRRGCPFDCGPCASHQQALFLPVIPITSACNMKCPICYTINRNDGAFFLTRAEMDRILDRLCEGGETPDIINFTGGEPTLHPLLAHFLEACGERGIQRLTVSTNGLRLGEEEYVAQLAELDARVVISHHTLRPDRDRMMSARDTVRAKTEALAVLERHGVATTLLPSIARGVNDDEIGTLFDLVVEKEYIRSLELHTLAFTGAGGAGFDRAARITVPDLHARLEEATGGRVSATDFVPSPLAHPHCYSICYLLLLGDGDYIPLARLMDRGKIHALLRESLYIEPSAELDELFRSIIDELWADPDRVPRSERILATLRRLLGELFPVNAPDPGLAEKRRIAERSFKAIYIHSHMDEENFDVSRAMHCCVGVPDASGGIIPTCSYNVMHRERDPRFSPRRKEEASCNRR